MGAHLRTTTAKLQGVHLLTVSGEVDLMVTGQFREALDKAVAGANSPLTIDLSDVRYLDAAGFGALISAQRQMNDRPDKLYIVVSSPFIRRLFSVLGLEAFFDLYASVDEAVAAAVKGKSQNLAPVPAGLALTKARAS
jgi:anti-anti-sigma factor